MTFVLASFCTGKLVKFVVTECPSTKTFQLSALLMKME